MSKGGSSPDKPKMSDAEKAQAAVAAGEWDHYKANYAPLEREYLAEAQQDHGARATAQAGTATMREATGSLQQIAAGGGTSRAAGTMANALASGRVAARANEQSLRDDRTLGALGIGRKLATDTTSSLSSLGRSGAQTAIGEMSNKLRVDSARSAALSQMAGTAAGIGAYAYMNGRTGAPTSVYDEIGAQTTGQGYATPGSSIADYQALMNPGASQLGYRQLMR